MDRIESIILFFKIESIIYSLLRYLCQIKYWFYKIIKILRINVEVTRDIKIKKPYIYIYLEDLRFFILFDSIKQKT